MKIFEGKHKNGDWGTKHNFIDDNDVYVGYDAEQSCCENADWFIMDSISTVIPEPLPKEKDLDGWNFDTTFFEQIPNTEDENGFRVLDDGGMVAFRLVKDGKFKYLHLFNCQNGYYGHSYLMEIAGKEVKEGRL